MTMEKLSPEDEIEYLKTLLAVTRAQLQQTMSSNAELEVILQRQAELVKNLKSTMTNKEGEK